VVVIKLKVATTAIIWSRRATEFAERRQSPLAARAGLVFLAVAERFRDSARSPPK
jgi:hypothetical protein